MRLDVSFCISRCTSWRLSTFFVCPLRIASIRAFCSARLCRLIRACFGQSVEKCRATELITVVREPAKRNVRSGYAPPNPNAGESTTPAPLPRAVRRPGSNRMKMDKKTAMIMRVRVRLGFGGGGRLGGVSSAIAVRYGRVSKRVWPPPSRRIRVTFTGGECGFLHGPCELREPLQKRNAGHLCHRAPGGAPLEGRFAQWATP